MNFFEQQDQARKKTRVLVLLLAMAVASLIAITTLFVATLFYYQAPRNTDNSQPFFQSLIDSINLQTFGLITLVIVAVVSLGSLYKYFQVRSGGKVVAEALGGRLVTNDTRIFSERKLLNVVEEMAIAAGTPVPPVYLLEEDSVNAFAAGNSPRDAVIGVTRGAIELLNREELQGVIAHEFSHVFHGDMKLNMRLIAILHGILVIGLIGEFLLRNSPRTRSSSKDNGRGAIMALGLGLLVIGYAGTFFGNLIKAAVSRQREFLADASSVQYTRNPKGIGNALKKLGGHTGSSRLSSPKTAEFSHLYFADGLERFFSMFATHPKLQDRIKRIEPYWNGEFIYTSADLRDEVEQSDQQFFNRTKSSGSTLAPGQQAMALMAAISQIGQPTADHLQYAQQTLASMDESLRAACHDTTQATAVIFGLLLHKKEQERLHQLDLLKTHLGEQEFNQLQSTLMQAAAANETFRLPLVELCLGSLKQLSSAKKEQLISGIHKLIYSDMRISGMEWALNHIIRHHLLDIPTGSQDQNLQNLGNEISQLLSMLAHSGADQTESAQKAFKAAADELAMSDLQLINKQDLTLTHVDTALEKLNRLKPLQKPKLLKAMVQCVMADLQVTLREAELLRAMAAALDCPIPPVLTTPIAA